MRDDPIALLERELVAAARRRAVVVDELPRSQEPRGPWPSSPRPARRRNSLGAFAAVVLSGVAVAVALGALVSLHGQKARSPRPVAAAAIPGREQLIDILGVLRRPQTKADLVVTRLPFLSHGPMMVLRGEPDLSLVRYATTTPWGERLYFVPLTAPSAAEIDRAARQFPGLRALIARRRPRGETLGVFSGDGGGGGGGGDAATIEAGEGMEIDGAGRAFAGGSTESRYILVVPDGVARVEYYFPAEAVPAGGPIYRHSLAVTAAVSGNVAAVQVDRECCTGQPALIWYAANGSVIKRIGSTASPPAPPQPGPETAQSRAAERNPATPNRIWVTPSSGGPKTAVKVQFRLLLNDVDYQFLGRGPSGSGCENSFGDISGGGSTDIRGRIFNDTFTPQPGGRWCPGVYRVTVAAYDLGREPGVLRHRPAPFGTATFTVRR